VLGFNLYRRTDKEGTYIKLNAELIPAVMAGTIQGTNYSYKDKTAQAGKKYLYKLEVVGVQGTLEWSDVIRVRKPPAR
jgi:hypothetical protein